MDVQSAVSTAIDFHGSRRIPGRAHRQISKKMVRHPSWGPRHTWGISIVTLGQNLERLQDLVSLYKTCRVLQGFLCSHVYIVCSINIPSLHPSTHSFEIHQTMPKHNMPQKSLTPQTFPGISSTQIQQKNSSPSAPSYGTLSRNHYHVVQIAQQHHSKVSASIGRTQRYLHWHAELQSWCKPWKTPH